MTPFIDEAKRLLRIAGRDYQTFTILRNHAEAELASIALITRDGADRLTQRTLVWAAEIVSGFDPPI